MSEVSPYQKFAEKMFQKDSKWIPKIVEHLINEEQANILVSLPGTDEELAEKFDRPKEDVAADLQEMFIKGLTFKKPKNDTIIWRAPMHLAQFHDATIVWLDATDEFLKMWESYMNEEWPKFAPMAAKFMPRPFTRVVPVDKSIDTGKAQVIAPESIRDIVNSADKIAVTKCTCRLTMKKCDAPVEVCLQINRGAEYTIERGTGRELTKEEALKVIEETEEAGLVHVTMNKLGVGHFICNCCGCCCQSFTMLISDGVNLCDPSRFKPEVDADLCSACGDCEERCYFGAIKVEDTCAVVVDDKCLGCGQCAIGCPEEAINLVEVREEKFIPA